VGAYGPRMLSTIGRLADGWIPSLGYLSPERIPEMQQRIDEGAEKVGRDPKEIGCAYNISGRIGPEGEGLLDSPISK